MHKFLNKIFFLIVCIIVQLGLVAADNDQDNDSDDNKQAIIIDYTVQEGDTLSSLTQEYLGDPSLWTLNAQINPELPNVNYLKPGTQIRLITGYSEPEPEVIASQATIVLKSNQVNKSLQGADWSDAEQGEDIFSGDGLRTLRESSAVLEFSNEEEDAESDQVQVYENSVVFLREERIEIEKGGAQIDLSRQDKRSDEDLDQYEVNVGGVITIPTLGIDGKSSTKARIGESDASQIMVYDGTSTVESAGVSVAVEKGMGTIAKAGEVPAEPERLLLSPALNSANPSSTELEKNVEITWGAMTGADHYRFDLCKDKACKSIVRSIDKLKQSSHTLAGLDVGEWFWRVTAVSPSGLDGFPSVTQGLNIFKPAPPPPEPEEEINWLHLIGLILGVYLICLLVIRSLSGKPDHRTVMNRHFKK